MRRTQSVGALLLIALPASASAQRAIVSAFSPNHGQAPARYAFVSQRDDLAILLAPDAITLRLASRDRDGDVRVAPIEIGFDGASANATLVGQCEQAGRVNYLRGRDPDHWLIGIPRFAEAHYRGLYPGIDLVLRDGGSCLEYDFILAPGARVATIALACRGARSVRIDEHGDLVADTEAGSLRQRRPVAYQVVRGEQRVRASRFRQIDATRFGFEVDDVDAEVTLVIDPGLEYSTFLGGVLDDRAAGIAVDAIGAAYVVGGTTSLDFPYTVDAFPTLPGANRNVFVLKLTPAGDDLIYATYFGGDDDDTGTDIAIDAAGNAVVVGTTLSSDFPTTPGAFSRTHHGEGEAFACKLDAQGVATYATLLGGTRDDYALGVDLDPGGNAWITGGARSSDFPVTSNAFDRTRNGDYDAFVAQVSANGQSLLYGTFFGGEAFDDAYDLEFFGSDQVFVTGRTRSSDLPTTSGAFDRSYANSLDTYVFRLDIGDKHLIYSTFVSAPVRDEGHAIAVDSQGNAYVAGEARSDEFPVTDDAYDTTFNEGYDGYVFKLDPSGGSLLYCTVIGGIGNDVAWDIAIDASGNAYVTGVTASANFPTTVGSYGPTFNGANDVFVCKFDPAGKRLLYSTLLGKGALDEGTGIALDHDGVALVTGSTTSVFFPTTANAYDTTWNGDYDAFVTRIDLHSSCPAASRSYGQGWPGTTGIPALQCEPPVLCRTIDLTVGNSYGHTTQSVLVAGVVEAQIPTVFGGTLLLIPSLVFPVSLPAQGVTLPVVVNCEASLCGLGVYLQIMEVDPGASRGISFSAGVDLMLGGD